jgi:biotin carboxyl carrier protein
MKKYVVTVNGTSYEVMVEEVSDSGNVAPQATQVVKQEPVAKAEPAPAPAQPKPTAPKPISTGTAGAKDLNCPMPGTIVKIAVKPGDSLKK